MPDRTCGCGIGWRRSQGEGLGLEQPLVAQTRRPLGRHPRLCPGPREIARRVPESNRSLRETGDCQADDPEPQCSWPGSTRVGLECRLLGRRQGLFGELVWSHGIHGDDRMGRPNDSHHRSRSDLAPGASGPTPSSRSRRERHRRCSPVVPDRQSSDRYHCSMVNARLRLLSRLVLLLFLGAAPARALEQWIYCAQNLWVDKNVDALETLLRRAAKAGYTHVLLTDSKFAKLGDMDARYFRNVERVKTLAAELKLKIVPAVFPVGYSNDLLWHDPNLIEALPVRDALFVVKGGEARLQPDPAVVLKGGDFSDLKKWDWKDENVIGENGAARMTDLNGG